MTLAAFALVASAALAAPSDDEGATVQIVTEQLLVLGTIIGAIAALPTLIEFLAERRKRRERLSLSLDDEPVSSLQVRLAGQEELLADIADLIDRAKHPEAYRSLTLGNEVLIIGPALSGKKSVARRIAQLAGFDRIITVYNPRNPDALARAKFLLRRPSAEKVMLLLPNIDEIVTADDEEVEAELDALIETTSSLHNILVVGTSSTFQPDSWIDNLFGMKVALPGASASSEEVERPVPPELRRVLVETARFYLKRAMDDGCVLRDIDIESCVAQVLAGAANPAEVEDIFEVARTAALYRKRTGKAREVEITPEILRHSMRRVLAWTKAPAG